MSIYVAEINGRGIAALNADQNSDAEKFVKNPAIEAELMVLENDGAPLWDGEASICVRAAFPDEQSEWRESRDQAMREEKISSDNPEIWLCFLVPVIDPTDPIEIIAQSLSRKGS